MDIEKLIERLKYDAADWAGDPHIKKDLFEAADTIETLRAENQDLRSDAAPVRRGSWEIKEFPFSHCKKMSCSICGYNESRGPAWNENFGLPNYCPNCGALMDGKEDYQGVCDTPEVIVLDEATEFIRGQWDWLMGRFMKK